MLSARTAWIFDLDGTLAQPQHDFDAMKQQLGLPLDLPLMEGLNGLPAARRAAAWETVAAWEHALADRALAATGVHDLLEALVGRGCRVGILTRNRRDVALRTLDALGLQAHFAAADVLGRDEAAPKPAPDGILRLLRRWNAVPSDAVMVGDSVHDVGAARAAGVFGVLVGPQPTAEAVALADLVLEGLPQVA